MIVIFLYLLTYVFDSDIYLLLIFDLDIYSMFDEVLNLTVTSSTTK